MTQKINLLIVDDEEPIVEMYSHIVDKTYFSITTAFSAEGAMDILKNIPIDVVVSDYRMGGSNSGLDLLRFINNEGLKCKFIMQTGYATVDTAIQAMKEGAFDFVTKPLNLLHFKSILDKCRERIITEQENIKLKSENIKLEELNIIKEKFIAITNHELRTPLTILKGYADLLEIYTSEYDDKDLIETMDIIKSTVNDMDAIIQRMHHVTSFSSKKIKLEIKEFDLNKMLQLLLKQFDIIATSHFLKIEYESNLEIANYLGDEKYIKEACSEILQNAIKFTPDNGLIKVKLYTSDNQFVVQFIDNGIGIEEIDRERIFDIFYESQDILHHTTTKQNNLGSSLGVGLSLVKEICQAHNIQYKIESTRQKGSSFFLYFNL
jgi:two-component system NtrC family sensor kinase